MEQFNRIIDLLYKLDERKFVHDALLDVAANLEAKKFIKEVYQINDPPLEITSYINFNEEVQEFFVCRAKNSNPETYTLGFRGVAQIHKSDINNELLQIVVDNDIVCVETFDFGLKAYYKGFTNDKKIRNEFVYYIKEVVDELL